MAGEPSRPDPDPSDDRVRITAADGRCCPELSVSLHDFIKPVVGTASQKDCELIPVSYRSAMREAGVTLGRRHQR